LKLSNITAYVYSIIIIFFAWIYCGSRFIPEPELLKYLFLAAVLFSAESAGAILNQTIKSRIIFSAPINFIINCGIGLGILSFMAFLVLAAGSANIYSYSIIIILPLALRLFTGGNTISSSFKNSELPQDCDGEKQHPAQKKYTDNHTDTGGNNNDIECSCFYGYFLNIIIIAILIFGFIFSVLPQTSWDALSYQLEIPKQYIASGKMFFINDIHFWGHPQLLNLIYSIFIIFKFDTLCSTLHWFYLLMTAGMILYFPFETAGIYISKNWKKLLAVLILTHPQILILSSYAYIDLGLMFYFTGACLFLLAKNIKYTAIFLGLALCVKYTGLIMSVIVALCIFYGWHDKLSEKLKSFFYVLTGAYAIFLPYLIKNFYFTKNPFYPFLDSFIFWPHVKYDFIEDYLTTLDMVGAGHSVSDILKFPFRISFYSQFYGNGFFDGVMGISFLVCIPFFIAGFIKCRYFGNNDNNEKLKTSGNILAVIFTLYFLFVIKAQSVRFFLPAAPVYYLLSIIGLKFLFEKFKFKHCYLCVFVIILIVNIAPVSVEFAKKEPLRYLLSLESRDDYLKRYLDPYPCIMQYNQIAAQNENTGGKCKLLQFYEPRHYYTALPYFWRDVFEPSTIDILMEKYSERDVSEKDIAVKIQYELSASGFTHILIGEKAKKVFILKLDNETQRKAFADFINAIKLIKSEKGYSLYEINNK